MTTIEQRIKAAIRDVPDFPKPGILFKDISPVMLDPLLCRDIVKEFIARIPAPPHALCAIESRGFFFGTLIASALQIPFIPIRKKGKLPGDVVEYSYDLEYGSAVIEIQKGVLHPGDKVLVHDDLIATGGTISAAAELVLKEQATVMAFSFLVDLTFLHDTQALKKYSDQVVALARY